MQTNTPCEIILADGAGHTFFERQAKQLQRVPDQPDARCDLVCVANSHVRSSAIVVSPLT